MIGNEIVVTDNRFLFKENSLPGDDELYDFPIDNNTIVLCKACDWVYIFNDEYWAWSTSSKSKPYECPKCGADGFDENNRPMWRAWIGVLDGAIVSLGR